ncbi:helix-turn-helix domain-containing protein [Desulfosarcina sp. OttesenSCG-928-A07]|nr:helix-turn-helix domain-containing protein [Desulfosarcina sp. OttesenSCG-928-G17]MDL2329890.1 helix-turn-helix domain-containing protein [Desulfosarcina sp. OttesenSCG-928-A07]
MEIDLSSVNGKAAFLESITVENCGTKLGLIRDAMMMTRRDLASVIGCSEATISRIEAGKTRPTADFMNRLLALVFIGHAKFQSLTSAERDSLLEYIRATGKNGAGISAALATVAASGTIAGLSAVGVTSGLSAIGGALLGRAALVASIPMAAGIATFGIFKAIRAICESNRLNCEEVDGNFEITSSQKESE